MREGAAETEEEEEEAQEQVSWGRYLKEWFHASCIFRERWGGSSGAVAAMLRLLGVMCGRV
ncbi:unnamed protein product [Sphenostylis stenocarpa]|uniref:Uncharacterized protein n=1 Tax=Sphenostylis stenocarpa TaxID=92480 RepID=A0AA86ST53_9FABA|nr:unnamed protein product [Sphenostylis stenocarpa]